MHSVGRHISVLCLPAHALFNNLSLCISGKQEEESYVCIYSHRHGDTILFHHEGGVDIGDVDAKASKLEVPIDHTPSMDEIRTSLLSHVAKDKQEYVALTFPYTSS